MNGENVALTLSVSCLIFGECTLKPHRPLTPALLPPPPPPINPFLKDFHPGSVTCTLGKPTHHNRVRKINRMRSRPRGRGNWVT